MGEKIRKTGINIIGDVCWGTHLCLFYQTREDLIDILVPYFKAGLENNEFCLWVTSEPLSEKEAEEAIRKAVPNFERYLKRGQIEIVPHTEWYLKDGAFNRQRVLSAWTDKLNQALTKDYDGMRVAGNTAWLEKRGGRNFTDYEKEINNVIGKNRMLTICTYSLDKCGASEVIDVVKNHQFALVRRKGKWELIRGSGRKRAEEELRESNQFVSLLFDSITDFITIQDVNYNIIKVNKVVEEVFGKGKLGRKCYQTYQGRDNICPACPTTKVLATGKPAFSAEQRGLHGIVVEIWAFPMKDEQGNIVAVVEQGRDITERKQAKEQLKESESFLNSIIDQSPFSTWISDDKGTNIRQNQACRELFGIERDEEIIGKYNIFADEEIRRLGFMPLIEEVFSKGKSVNFVIDYDFRKVKHVKVTGATHKILNCTISPIKDTSGKVTNVVVQHEDITERKQAEEELKRSSKFSETVLNSMNDAISVINVHDYRIVRVNNAFLQRHGLKEEAVIGKICYQITHHRSEPCTPPDDTCPLQNTVTSGEHSVAEHVHYSKDGEKTYVEISTSPVKDENGKVVQVVHIAHNITERKRAGEALRESEEKFRGIFNKVPASIILLDKDGKIADINPYHITHIGKGKSTQKDYLGENLVTHPSIVNAGLSEVYARLLKGEAFDLKDVYFPTTTGGADGYFNVKGAPIFKEGKVIGALAMHEDITERKQAEDFIRTQAEVTKNMTEGVYIVGLHDVIIRWANHKFEEMFGYEPGEMIGKHASIVNAPVNSTPMERANEIMEVIRRTGEWHGEVNNIKKDGTPFWCYASVSVFTHTEYGEVLLAVHRDITERKQAEEQKTLSLRVLELLSQTGEQMEQIHGILMLIKEFSGLDAVGIRLQEGYDFPYYDTVGFVKGHVPAENRLCTLNQKGELIRDSAGNPILECMCGNIICGRFDPRKPFFSDGGSFWTNSTTELLASTTEEDRLARTRNRCNGEGYESVALIPLKSEESTIGLLQLNDMQRSRFTPQLIEFYERIGKSIGVIFARKQAEEREKQLQAELYLSSRLAAIGELASGVAHEINNPLTGIIGYSQLLIRKSTDKGTKKDLQTIHSEAQRVAKIVQNLLTFARNREPKRQYSDINAILQKTLELRAYELKTSSIEVVTDLAPSLPKIVADFYQIQEVFLNIILNAGQAMTEAKGRGKLSIKTQQMKDYVRISFIDDGPGISKENLRHVFDPFFTTKEVGKGTGLGLSICHGIVAEHGGKIYAKSKPGEGATFFVELPLTTEKIDKSKAAEEESAD